MNVFQNSFLQIANGKASERNRNQGILLFSKAARQILQAFSRAGIHKICKAAGGAKHKCAVEHVVHISNQFTTFAMPDLNLANRNPYCAISAHSSDPQTYYKLRLIINMQL